MAIPKIRGGELDRKRRHRRRRKIPGHVPRPPWSVGNNSGYELFLDITDCVSNCGDHGQGTHSGNVDWRRSCFKSCTDTIHGQTN